MANENTKFGYCLASSRWIPRDEMLSVNVKCYDGSGDEQKIQIRLAHDEYHRLVDQLRELKWNNELLTRKELRDDHGVDV